MTEPININNLADYCLCSTIKTLPATLPEPSSSDRGPRTGVTGAVSQSDVDILGGVGGDTRGWAVASSTLVDGLAEAVGGDRH